MDKIKEPSPNLSSSPILSHIIVGEQEYPLKCMYHLSKG